MSNEKIQLKQISDTLDETLSKSGHNYKFFPSKNSRRVNNSGPTEQDKEAASSYKLVVAGIYKRLTNYFNDNKHNSNKVVARTSLRPETTNRQIQKVSNSTVCLPRCEKCSCVLKNAVCPYCSKDQQDIEILDTDSDEFPSIEHCLGNPTNKMSNQQISTTNFYPKENRSFSNYSKSNVSLVEDEHEHEESRKYEIDYLFVGTCRLISRTCFRISSDKFTLTVNSDKNGLAIDHKLIYNIQSCESKKESSKHIYFRISFSREAVNAINGFLSKFNDVKGTFKAVGDESINGHEKYFLMKLKYLADDELVKLKKRLKIYFPNKFKEDHSVYEMFEEQRVYCNRSRNGNNKKSKTSDSRSPNEVERLKTYEIKREIRNSSRDEPMEVDRVYSSTPTRTTRSSTNSNNQKLFTVCDRPTIINDRTHLKRKTSTLSSSNSIRLYVDQDEDSMEISEIDRPKFSLPIKSIKNNKILFETTMGETLVIGKSDLFCLNDGNFLNDKIIEFYLMYIKSNLIEFSTAQKTYIFSSFFFTKLMSLTKGSLSEEQFNENQYNLVKNWIKNIDIFEYDFLIVPIFRNYHWNLAIIAYPGKMVKDDFEIILDCDDNEKPAIIFMDSMGRNRIFSRYSKYLRNFLQKECQYKKNLDIEFGKQMVTLDPEVPCQLNGYDCGIFVLHYVELFLKDANSIIQKIRTNKKSLENWFSSCDLNNKRKDIFNILFKIYEDNLKDNLKFESEEDLTLKSDEEIEIITNEEDKNKELFSDDEDTML